MPVSNPGSINYMTTAGFRPSDATLQAAALRHCSDAKLHEHCFSATETSVHVASIRIFKFWTEAEAFWSVKNFTVPKNFRRKTFAPKIRNFFPGPVSTGRYRFLKGFCLHQSILLIFRLTRKTRTFLRGERSNRADFKGLICCENLSSLAAVVAQR